ncbi:hypothetical protein FB473_002684 [Brooklawnia cerclae]|uniref:Uncharacterized protein n=1 Tax=Brooklawnia cerclae TaxID=349934 RepID=A0ABX0SI07_9ACTN|nr:hypothetical protein [Brooklawnia cerclae]
MTPLERLVYDIGWRLQHWAGLRVERRKHAHGRA